MNRLEERVTSLESAAVQTAEKVAWLEQEAAVTKREMALLRRDFDQSLVDRDSNVAIHSLNNYIVQCRSLVAAKANYGSWSSLHEGTGSHSERNRICEPRVFQGVEMWRDDSLLGEFADPFKRIRRVEAQEGYCAGARRAALGCDIHVDPLQELSCRFQSLSSPSRESRLPWRATWKPFLNV